MGVTRSIVLTGTILGKRMYMLNEKTVHTFWFLKIAHGWDFHLYYTWYFKNSNGIVLVFQWHF